jgi:hypothetical protein
MKKKYIPQKPKLLLPTYILSWFFLQLLMSKLFFFFANKFSSGIIIKPRDVINFTSSYFFWESISGISLKILIEVIVTTVLVYTGFVIVRKKAVFSIILSTVILANSVFLVQMIGEYLYVIINFKNIRNIEFETFSLFSVSYFLNQFQYKVPRIFDYAFQVLSVFEISYVLTLTYLIKKIFEIQLVISFRIILISYIFPLLTWLLLIMLLSLL